MKYKLIERPIHLGLEATVTAEPIFTGFEWYAAYEERHKNDGKEGRLVSIHSFAQPWDVWEMHPTGSEVVFCVQGEITLIQELEKKENRVLLLAGEYAINPPGIWHTADVESEATVLFITAGKGTEHRKRN